MIINCIFVLKLKDALLTSEELRYQEFQGSHAQCPIAGYPSGLMQSLSLEIRNLMVYKLVLNVKFVKL